MEDYYKWNMLLNILTRMHQLLEYLPKMVILINQILIIGVVLAAEKKEFTKLFVPTKESGKLYKMDEHIVTSVSGVVADANFLIDYGRLHCQ
jgi:Proteasome subunit